MRLNVPRIVVYPSSGSFSLVNILFYQQRATRSGLNIAKRAGHIYGLNFYDWRHMNRVDLLYLCYLAGAWRCTETFSTLQLLTNPCDHLIANFAGLRRLSEENLVLSLNSLNIVTVFKQILRFVWAQAGCVRICVMNNLLVYSLTSHFLKPIKFMGAKREKNLPEFSNFSLESISLEFRSRNPFKSRFCFR